MGSGENPKKERSLPVSVELVYDCVCVAGFLATALWCIITFVQDHDVSRVELKEYHENPDSVYPSISIMIVNPFLDEKLQEYGDGINSITYSKFLAGKHWDDRMLGIDYDNVTIDLNKYFLGYEMFSDNFSVISINNFTDDPATSYAWSKPYKNFRSAGWQTYAVDPPFNTYGGVTRFLVQASIIIQTDIFHDSVRPSKYDYDQDSPTWGGFEVWFHYPNQLMEAWHMGMGKWFWPNRDGFPSQNYEMNFQRSKMDVLERRNKKNSPCIEDWKNHDEYVIEQIVTNAGCRPPHWKTKQDVRLCASQEEMLKVFPPLKKHEFLDYVPPCRSITNIPFSYSETDYGLGNSFRITLTCADPSFKSIAEVREYSVQNLIGNTGGYLGLILGCSIIQLPVFVFRIYKRLYSVKVKKKTKTIMPLFTTMVQKPNIYEVNKSDSKT